MAATNGTGTEQLVGRVVSVNEKGLRIEGRDGWVNFSKFAQDLVPPSRGSVVAVQLDGQGFIRRVAPAEATAPHQAHTAGREAAIIRQTCIKAAAEFCASRPDLKSADLFALAERMERWITREGDAP